MKKKRRGKNMEEREISMSWKGGKEKGAEEWSI